jgi:hypothetical protein
MQAVVNSALPRKRIRIASVCHITALSIFAFGLIYSWTNQDNFDSIYISYATIVVGLILYQIGQVNLRRWGPRFRQDDVLTKSLKGLDNRHSFLAFPSSNLPDYIVVGPTGVKVITPRNHAGEVACINDRWSQARRGGAFGIVARLFSSNPLGDPTRDAQSSVSTVTKQLRKRGFTDDDMPPVSGLIAFTNPAVKLRVQGASVPVARLKQVRALVSSGRPALDARQIQRAVDALSA